MLSAPVKNYLPLALLALAAGFLVALAPFSVLALLALLGLAWFALERFETATLLLVAYLPFQVALNVASGFDVASGRVLILGLFLIWLLRSLKNRQLEVDFSLPSLLLGFFLLMVVFSLGQAFETDRAVRKLLVLFSVLPLYWVLVAQAPRREYIVGLVRSLLVPAGVIALFALGQFGAQFVVGINPLFDFFAGVIAPVFLGNTFAAEVVANPSWLVNVGGVTLLRAFALFADPHIFSFYLGLVVPLLAALLTVDRSVLQRAGLSARGVALGALLGLGAELATFSRGGYVGMGAGLTVLFVLAWRYLTGRQKRTLALGVAAVGALVLATNSSVVMRLLSSFDLREGSNVERLKNWQQGAEVFLAHPLGGVGLGQYSFYLDPTAAYRTPIYAHNLYLDLGAELGVFALLAWVLLILLALRDLFRASRRTADPLLRALALGLIGSLVWYSAHSCFDTSLYAPNLLALLAVILALSRLVVKQIRGDK